MLRSRSLRPLLASAALATTLALAGCNTDSTPSVGGRHLQPLSEKMLADIESRNMAPESPILVRIFKEESELEVWKEDRTGKFALLRTYPVCRWSGELGPKIKEGDRQAPEGFYTITPGLMNPNSNYYLAINTGFPNAYDRANGRTGAFLMIHGDCSSRGCYAMTDEQIAEIYSLARESFFGGQKSFQIQAMPFRMTALNMARHRNSPHMAFWKMLKQGYDHFEVTRHEPKVDVCERRYVFDAEGGSKFGAADRCPAYRVPEEIASAVRDKQRRDEAQTAELVSRGTPAAPVRTGVDGGMNATFLAAVKQHGGGGATIRTASGTIPPHVNPPAESRDTTGSTFPGGFGLASAESRPAAAPTVQVASATGGGISGFFSNLFGSKEEEKPSPDPAKSKAAPKAAPTAAKSKTDTRPAESKPTETRTAQASPRPPTPPARAETNARAEPSRQEASADSKAGSESKPAAGSSLLSGAAPTVPSGGFDGRFGAWR
ncbi:MAG: murein L,D-transpeptidase [Hyphomicrobiales bacterium]|nr:murein L,D-transpeptidase [Hyphomicrobiales bacterium]